MSERAGERRSVMWLFGALCLGAERAACGSNRLFIRRAVEVKRQSVQRPYASCVTVCVSNGWS